MPKKKSDPNARALLAAWLAEEALLPRELAERLGVTRSCVHYWLTGHSTPRRPTARKLEDVTGGRVPRGAW